MVYYNRKIDFALQQWSNEKRRKPLMLRGARQVGKTSAVRHLGKQFNHFVEINFENKDHAVAKTVFAHHSDPRIICNELALLFTILTPSKRARLPKYLWAVNLRKTLHATPMKNFIVGYAKRKMRMRK